MEIVNFTGVATLEAIGQPFFSRFVKSFFKSRGNRRKVNKIALDQCQTIVWTNQSMQN